MPLYKLEVLVPHYREEFFNGKDIKGLGVYVDETNEKIGLVDTLLLDEAKTIRYLVVDVGFWFFGKKVLLPISYCRINAEKHRIEVLGVLRKEQAELLPAYNDSATVDPQYEDQVMATYQALVGAPPPAAKVAEGLATDHSGSQAKPLSVPSKPNSKQLSNPSSINALSENMADTEQHSLKLYAEKLVGGKHRHKTGEITVRKQIISEVDDVSVPTAKEKIVIEITTLSNASTYLAVQDTSLQPGGIIQMDIYQEIASVDRQATVQQEVTINKEVIYEQVRLEDTVRKEELDVKFQKNPSRD